MHTLLIVSHPSVDSHFIEETLQFHGMTDALRSRTHSLSASEISTKLLKSSNAKESNNFKQLKAGTLWNELAIDLLLGNVEQNFWGWSDSQSIYFLDYWKSNVPDLKYILVYSSPEGFITSEFRNKTVTKKELREKLKQWESYNKELTSFYLNHKKSCLLINDDQVKNDTSQFIESVSKLLTITLDQPKIGIEEENEIDNNNKVVNQADLFLAQNLIKPFSSSQDTFEELQSIANMPYLAKDDTANDSLSAWNDLHNNQQYNNTELDQENELLLLQLHQVQEELEHYYIENQNLKLGSPPIDYTLNKPYYGAADRIRKQLGYQLGACMIKQSKSISGWITMPITFYQVTKKFNNEKPEREKLPPTSQYQDAYEAERIKKHLSYRLGSTLLSHAKSPIGWVKLPFALKHEISDFQRERSGQ